MFCRLIHSLNLTLMDQREHLPRLYYEVNVANG